MNPQEMALEYPWADYVPELGQMQEVAPGVNWIRMPLPFALDHINLWLLRDNIDGRDGWTIVDCGIDKPEVRAAWESVFANCLAGLPVLRVIVTHMHPDHVGLAHWLCERWQAPLWMSMTDYVLAQTFSANKAKGGGLNGEAAVEHFSRHGLQDLDAQEKIRARNNYYPSMVPGVPTRFRRMLGGQEILIGGNVWQTITGYGHSPEHISLWCPKLAVVISGDMVLPRISTNVSVFNFEPEADPLGLYLSSLSNYDPVPEETLVLPSHGRPFKGLHTRIQQQHEHHAQRLAEVLQACSVPTTAYELLPVLFKRKLDIHQLTFAMGESIAHLNALYFKGQLKRTFTDNIYYFQTADSRD